MTDNTDPVEVTLRGKKNFTLLKLAWRSDSEPFIRLEILSSMDEMMQISRAQNWCDEPGPGNDSIKDDDLRNHVEQCYLLWYALRDSKKTIPNKYPEEYEKIYKTAQALQADLDGEHIDWLLAEYTTFRKKCSPFRTADDSPDQKAYDDLLLEIRKQFSERQKDVTRFKLWYCAKHGILPTEERFRDMTYDQFSLYMSVTPMSQLAECFPEMAPDDLKKYGYGLTFVDVAGQEDEGDEAFEE